jgi:hypothetical protein
MMELQQLNQQWQEEFLDMNKKVDDIQKLKEKTNKEIIDLENETDKLRTSLENCKRKLESPHQNVDKRLVKPARGLIMYGPPGMFYESKVRLLNIHLYIYISFKVLANQKLSVNWQQSWVL